eukprot:g991.t1
MSVILCFLFIAEISIGIGRSVGHSVHFQEIIKPTWNEFSTFIEERGYGRRQGKRNLCFYGTFEASGLEEFATKNCDTSKYSFSVTNDTFESWRKVYQKVQRYGNNKVGPTHDPEKTIGYAKESIMGLPYSAKLCANTGDTVNPVHLPEFDSDGGNIHVLDANFFKFRSDENTLYLSLLVTCITADQPETTSGIYSFRRDCVKRVKRSRIVFHDFNAIEPIYVRYFPKNILSAIRVDVKVPSSSFDLRISQWSLSFQTCGIESKDQTIFNICVSNFAQKDQMHPSRIDYCGSQLYGRPVSPILVRDYILYYQRAGVDKFHFYDRDPENTKLKEVLDPYIEKGVATYTYFPPFHPVLQNDIKIGHKDWMQVMVLNHCLLRHRNSAEWLWVADLDEWVFSNASKYQGDGFLYDFVKDHEKETNDVVSVRIGGVAFSGPAADGQSPATSYTRRQNFQYCQAQCSGRKSIIKSSRTWGLYVHEPFVCYIEVEKETSQCHQGTKFFNNSGTFEIESDLTSMHMAHMKDGDVQEEGYHSSTKIRLDVIDQTIKRVMESILAKKS